MRQIYWDTMLFAYWLEDTDPYAEPVGKMLETIEKRGDRLITSAFAVGEAMAGPYKRGRTEAARLVHHFFRPPRVTVVPFSIDMTEKFASLRATLSVSSADAIHLATAATVGVDLFVTNDKKIQKLPPIDGIRFLAGLDGIVL